MLLMVGTSRTPGSAGTAGRAPTLRKIRSASSVRAPTATVRGPVSRACPSMTSRPGVAFSQSATPLRPSSTIRSTRARTAGMSTATGPVAMPYSAARRAIAATRALAISVLVGRQP